MKREDYKGLELLNSKRYHDACCCLDTKCWISGYLKNLCIYVAVDDVLSMSRQIKWALSEQGFLAVFPTFCDHDEVLVCGY